MAGYDPKRARPATDAPADEPAPVDALLGETEASSTTARPAPATDPSPAPPPAVTPRPVEPLPGPEGSTGRIVVVAGVAAATVAAILLIRRRRR
jgi:MYXO-CTERM domain-containing protein